jgi:hypothetical protein
MHVATIGRGRRTMPAVPPCSSALLDEAALTAWFSAAAAGDRIEYWRGFLAVDANPTGSKLEPDDRRQLGRVAARAFRLAEQGKAHLIQKRHSDADYSYLLVVRPRPRPVRARFASAVVSTAGAITPAIPHSTLEVA